MAKRTISTAGGVSRYFLDGQEVTGEAWHANWYVKPPNYAKGECPRVESDHNDFSAENSGRGRFNPQLRTYVKSKQDTIDKGKAKGFSPLG